MGKTVGNKRSPLKSKPLRNPGQSLDEEIERLIDAEGVPYIIMSIFAVLLAALVWLWYLLDTQPNPILLTLLAIVAVAFSANKVIKLRKRLKTLKLGRDGEKIVGQYLEELRENGYRVFHDIICNGSNIDHVVVSAGGIFTVETKTYSKPAKGPPEIIYDGKTIVIDGWETDKDILSQAAAQRQWLKEELHDSTGKRFPIRAVIVFPGWFIKQKGQVGRDGVWVLNPKALPTYIQNEKKVLSSEDINLAASRIALYIRTLK